MRWPGRLTLAAARRAAWTACRRPGPRARRPHRGRRRLAACPGTTPAAPRASAAAGDAGQMPSPRCPGPVSPSSAAGARIVSRLMPAGRVRAGCDTGPGTCRLPGADRGGARPPAGRGTRSRSPGSSTPGPPARGRGVVRVAVTCAFTAMARPGRRPRHRRAAIVRGWPVRAGAGQASSHVWVCRYRCGPVRRRVPLVAKGPGI